MKQDSGPKDMEKMIGKAVMEAMRGSVYARQMIQKVIGDVMQDVHEAKEQDTPYVDLIDRNDEVVALIALPGTTKEGIDLRVTEDMLSVETKAFTMMEGKYLRREISPKGFKRDIKLPEEIKPEQARASYENGVLEVHLPKLIVVSPHTVPVQ